MLGHSRFGIDTDLYSAGLDSLGSVLLLTDLYEKLQLSMTLNDLLEHASVLKLEALYKERATFLFYRVLRKTTITKSP